MLELVGAVMCSLFGAAVWHFARNVAVPRI